MKSRKSLVLLLWSVSLVMGLGGAGNSASAQSLRKERIGAVAYSVSDANRMIHVEFPLKVDLSLIESHDLPADSRYTLSIQGEVDTNPARAEIIQIKNRYPGYRIADQSGSVSVSGCEVRLSDGSSVECSIPPGTGNYFSVLQLLNWRRGEALKSEIAQKKYPKMNIQLRRLEPRVRAVESVRVPYGDLYRSLQDQATPSGVTVAMLLQSLAELSAEAFNHVRSKSLLKQALEALIKKCTTEKVERFPQVGTLSTLLGTRIQTRAPTESVGTLTIEEVEWAGGTSEGVTDVTAEVIQGD